MQPNRPAVPDSSDDLQATDVHVPAPGRLGQVQGQPGMVDKFIGRIRRAWQSLGRGRRRFSATPRHDPKDASQKVRAGAEVPGSIQRPPADS